MSKNSSTRLLRAKIEYKEGLLLAEKSTKVEDIKPVENQALTPQKSSLIRTMFAKAVSSIKTSWETDYAHEFAQSKPMSSFLNLEKFNSRVQSSKDNSVNL